MIKIATPISNLFENSKYAKEINRNSDCLECRDETIYYSEARQEVFHCELQPIHRFTDKEFNYLKKIKKMKPELKLITFSCASSCDRPNLKNGIFEIAGKEYSGSLMKKIAKENLKKIKKIFGKEVNIGIENNNFYSTEAYKYITEPEFISSIVYDNDIEFLFDIAHAKITAHNKNICYKEYLNKLPIDRITQLHICRHSIKKNNLAYDAHNYPGEEEFKEVKNLINEFNIQYLTIEFYKNLEILITSLKKLRELI